MDLTDIFKKIVSVATLTDEHREQLKTKRGFSDELINNFKFKSAGAYLQNNARLGYIPEGIQASLFYSNILIPYLDPEGGVYHLRPHKFGFKGAGIRVFIPYQLMTVPAPRLVLAESEFKAIASCVLGVPAIGVPGISSFSKSHLGELIEILKGLECREVVVCFDNEVKDDPALPNFKPDFTKRYDTSIYAYIMSASLKKEGFETKIATLKPKWMIEGKADIDGCLAQGIDPEEYQSCIDDAVDPGEYRKSWKIPKLHKSYVERRVDKFFYAGPISEEHKCYYFTPSEAKKPRRRLTNFAIRIIHTLYSGSGAERYCQLESTYGNSTQVIITPDIMVSKVAFQKFCYELGDFEFYGQDMDLGQLWSYVIMSQEGRGIKKLKSFGYDEESKIWFFQNGAYYKGELFTADEEGIVWVEDVGYLIPKATVEKENFMAPALDTTEAKVNIEEVAKRFAKVFSPNHSRLILGWTLGNFFMPEILQEFKVFPFLFFYGKQQSGKSTLANWVSSFFGFIQQGIPYSSSSQVGISRTVAQLSMIPVWLEEYRNQDPFLASKNNMLRSIYDKSTIVKGTKKEDEIKTYRARSTLMISGEEYPQDAALNSRCMLIPVYRHHYENSEDYYWMIGNASLFNQVGHRLLLLKDLLWPKISQRIKEYLAAFEKGIPGSDSRSRLHHAVLAGVADTLLGRSPECEAFIAKNVLEKTSLVDRSQAINVFLEDLQGMFGADKLGDTVIIKKVFLKESDGKRRERLAFWFHGAYMLWENYFRGQRRDLPASKNALIEHITSEDYYIGNKRLRIGKQAQYCMVLNFEHEKFPLPLNMMLASLEMEDNAPWVDEVEEANEPEPVH